ncbi:sel1 repeat family protein [Aeromonas jandaei]|uniref:sel1 repeat family protein n=1 Tax=Aeromonas jandaei TaxID=650 RepID=UPI000F54702D|nr:sel1 repeat family protein [Aeromonas jandaei]RQM70661.1 sel1 repeat family protein [Aeromonas jandaei]
MKALFLTTLLLATPVWATQERAQELYDLAVVPWEQGTKKGADLMWQAADMGHARAQCLIAKSNLTSVWVWSDISYKYFKMAADQDALCGLLALSVGAEGGVPIMRPKQFETDNISTGEYKKRLNAILAEQVARGDVEALKLKGFLSDNKNEECALFEKAAQKNDPDAQFRLANKIEDGCGWYLIPGSRKKAVRYWIEQAANHGNPRAMEEMAGFAHDAGNISEMLAWYDKAIATGNENSLALASSFLMGDRFIPIPEQYHDLVRAYALNYILRQYNPSNNNEYYSPYSRLNELDKKLTKAEKEQAITWAKEWMKNHQVRTYGLVLN